MTSNANRETIARGASNQTIAESVIPSVLINGDFENQGSNAVESVHPKIMEQLSNSSVFDFDIAVIGSGPAGYVAAIRAAQLGARVAIIEKSDIGGTCLNIGCIPTKTLLGTVSVLNHIKKSSDFGISVSDFNLDVAKIMERKESVVKRLTSGVEMLLKKNKCKLFRGMGIFKDAHVLEIHSSDGIETIKVDKIIIATGSVPALLPLPGFQLSENVWTSSEALNFCRVPESIIIVGAGAIGLEAGYTFACLGTKVTIVELMAQILPAADTEVANYLQKQLEKAGIEFILGASVDRAEDVDNVKQVYIRKDGVEISRRAEKILIAVGRRAAIDGIGLENVGVKTDGRKILVNERMQTNVPNIYAAGDVVGEPMLAHVGWTEGIVAVENAMGMNVKMDYRSFPACVYTSPECASIGLTEQQARERYKQVSIGKFSFSHNGKAMGIGQEEGFVKLVIEPRYHQILGAHLIGPHVTDLVSEIVLAMRNELTVDELIAAIHPHPTLSEAVQEAGYDALGRAIHK